MFLEISKAYAFGRSTRFSVFFNWVLDGFRSRIMVHCLEKICVGGNYEATHDTAKCATSERTRSWVASRMKKYPELPK